MDRASSMVAGRHGVLELSKALGLGAAVVFLCTQARSLASPLAVAPSTRGYLGVAFEAPAWSLQALPRASSSAIPAGVSAPYGTAIEVRQPAVGLAMRFGKLWLPTGPEAIVRPDYLVLDHRPDAVLSIGSERELGFSASYRPHQVVEFTIGAFNNKATYHAGYLPVKDTITRIDVNLAGVHGGGFYYYGTGRWLGDKTRAGIDATMRVGSLDLTAQVLQGLSYGVQQFGWYAAVSRRITARTTLVAKVDQFNREVPVVDSLTNRLILAVVESISTATTFKLNYEVYSSNLDNPPIGQALIGQFTTHFH